MSDLQRKIATLRQMEKLKPAIEEGHKIWVNSGSIHVNSFY